jgi:hypothetical protein
MSGCKYDPLTSSAPNGGVNNMYTILQPRFRQTIIQNLHSTFLSVSFPEVTGRLSHAVGYSPIPSIQDSRWQCFTLFKSWGLFLIINPQLPNSWLLVRWRCVSQQKILRQDDERSKIPDELPSDLAFVQAVWSRPRHVTLQNAETRSLSLSQRSKGKKTHWILITLDPQSLSLEKP